MKKACILFGALLFSLSTFAQLVNQMFTEENRYISHSAELGLINEPITPMSSTATAPVNPFWSSDFSNSSDWVLDNTGSFSNEGWNIDATVDSWAFTAAINSTSGGSFAELTNGDPFAQSTWPMNVVYTMTTTNPINVYDSIGSSNATLNYLEYGARFNDLQEVQVSTDGINFTTVADNLSYAILSTSGGSSYPNPTLRTVNIGPGIASNPNSVWIRFSWTTNLPNSATNPNVWVAYGWMIDDVQLSETPANSISLIEENFGGWLLSNPTTTGDMGIPYTFNPLNQASANGYECEGAIINAGGMAQYNTQLHVDIDNGSTSVFSGTSTPATVNPSDTLVVAVSSNFIPAIQGAYNVAFWATSDSANTDTVTRTTIVTDTVYARDYDWDSDGSGVGNGRYGLGASCGGQVLANGFEVYAADDVTSISFFVDDKTNIGGGNADVKVELYEYSPGVSVQTTPPILVAESGYYSLTLADMESWVTLRLDNPYSVVPSAGATAYLAAVRGVQHPTDTSFISTSGNEAVVTYVQDNGCELGGSGSALGIWYSYSNTVMIRMNLGDVSAPSNIYENAFDGLIVAYPNPSSGIFTLEMNEVNNDRYNVTINNLLGQTVYVIEKDINGFFTEDIDITKFGKGTYLITISNSSSRITKKLVIE